MATAAMTLGVVTVAKAVKRRAAKARARFDDLKQRAEDKRQEPVIDLEPVESGSWRMADPEKSA